MRVIVGIRSGVRVTRRRTSRSRPGRGRPMPMHDLAARALSGTTYEVRPYRATPVPTRFERHVMNRMGCGFSQGTWQQMRAQGGADRVVRAAARSRGGHRAGRRPAHRVLVPPPRRRPGDPVGQRHRRPGYALGVRPRPRQLDDAAPDLLPPPGAGDDGRLLDQPPARPRSPATTAWAERWDYDQTIRAHALGRFEDLLLASALHPAMLMYLDNFDARCGTRPTRTRAASCSSCTRSAATSGYTEQMVRDSAMILSRLDGRLRASWERATTPPGTPPDRCRCSASPTPTPRRTAAS